MRRLSRCRPVRFHRRLSRKHWPCRPDTAHHLSVSFMFNIHLLNSDELSMATTTGIGQRQGCGVAGNEARPARSRNGQSNGSRHSGITGDWDGHVDGLVVGEVVVEQVALIAHIRRELWTGEDSDQLRSCYPADQRTDAALAPGIHVSVLAAKSSADTTAFVSRTVRTAVILPTGPRRPNPSHRSPRARVRRV